MCDDFERNFRRFDLACQNRDLRAARRLMSEYYSLVFPGRPLDLWKINAVVRTYAADIHGWEIDDA